MKIAGLLLIAILLAACAPSYLYYGNVSQHHYQYVKSPDPVSRQEYKHSLEKVFAKSEQYKLPVPPGLYCDYALLLATEGDYAAAREYFLKEKAQWAESSRFIDFLLARYGLQD